MLTLTPAFYQACPVCKKAKGRGTDIFKGMLIWFPFVDRHGIDDQTKWNETRTSTISCDKCGSEFLLSLSLNFQLDLALGKPEDIWEGIVTGISPSVRALNQLFSLQIETLKEARQD